MKRLVYVPPTVVDHARDFVLSGPSEGSSGISASPASRSSTSLGRGELAGGPVDAADDPGIVGNQDRRGHRVKRPAPLAGNPKHRLLQLLPLELAFLAFRDVRQELRKLPVSGRERTDVEPAAGLRSELFVLGRHAVNATR